VKYKIETDAAKEKYFCGIGTVISKEDEVIRVFGTLYGCRVRTDQAELLSIYLGLKDFVQLVDSDDVEELSVVNDNKSIIHILNGESKSSDNLIHFLISSINELLCEYGLISVKFIHGESKTAHNLAQSEKTFYKQMKRFIHDK
jgi:hypothetical protein